MKKGKQFRTAKGSEDEYLFRLRIAIVAPTVESRQRFLSLPTAFFDEPLPPAIGHVEHPTDYTLNWRLEVSEGTADVGSRAQALSYERLFEDYPVKNADATMIDAARFELYRARDPLNSAWQDSPECMSMVRDQRQINVSFAVPDLSVVILLCPPQVELSELVPLFDSEHLKRLVSIRLFKQEDLSSIALLQFTDGVASKSFLITLHYDPTLPRCPAGRLHSVEFVSAAPVIESLFDETEFKCPPSDAQLQFTVQLPTCASCIARIDTNYSGITLPASNADLPSYDPSCDVCRTISSLDIACPCGTTQNLWACIICGHVGCDRYHEGHAKDHFIANPSHAFALEINTHRVWDYLSDR